MFPQINNLMLMAGKLFFIASSIFYLIFAVIIVKQTTVMSKNVHDKFNSILISFSFLHLAFAGFLVILTLVLL